MSSTLAIPPADILTRIVGMRSRKVLFSNERDTNCLNHVDMTTPYNDQYWYIKPGKDANAGRYMIVSYRTNRALFVNPDRAEGNRIGTWQPDDKFNDQHFDLNGQRGQGLQAGQFCLHAPSTGGVIFSRRLTDITLPPGSESGVVSPIGSGFLAQLGCNRVSDGVRAENWFTFELEPLDCVGVDFDVANAKIKSIQPKSIFSQTSKNDTNVTQTPIITISETTEQQSTFETEVGVEIGITTSFSCGVPMVAEGKVEVSAKVHTNQKWGTTNTTSQMWEASVPLTVPPYTHLRVTATVTESVLDVPFTTTWKSPKTGKTTTTKGMFRGLSSSELATSFFPVNK
jgi:hypothetical protein